MLCLAMGSGMQCDRQVRCTATGRPHNRRLATDTGAPAAHLTAGSQVGAGPANSGRYLTPSAYAASRAHRPISVMRLGASHSGSQLLVMSVGERGGEGSVRRGGDGSTLAASHRGKVLCILSNGTC